MPTIEEGEVIKEFRTRNEDLDTGIDDYPSCCDYDKKIHIDFLEDMDAYRDEGMGNVIFGKPFLREVGIKARWFEGMITIYNGNESVTYQMVRSRSRFKHHTNEQCNKIPPLLKVSDEDKKNGISHPYQKLKGFYKGVLNLGPDYIRDAKTEEWLIREHISKHEMEHTLVRVQKSVRPHHLLSLGTLVDTAASVKSPPLSPPLPSPTTCKDPIPEDDMPPQKRARFLMQLS
ncbi:hypothetical protein Tco_1087506 [Tanacetum coccineum]